MLADPRRNGCRPDLPDHRDRPYSEVRPRRLLRALSRPGSAYLRADLLPVMDQGNLGSCTAQGVGLACDYAKGKDHHPEVVSRLSIYYWTRGGVPEDTGGTVREAVKLGVAKRGVPLESLWAYDLARWKDEPSPAAQAEGAHRAQGFEYYRCADLGDVQDSIAQGYAVAFGIPLFDQFDHVGHDGFVAMPAKGEKPTGYHCVCAVGYASKISILGRRGGLFVQNSWGPGWGFEGRFWLPFDYFDAHGFDPWHVRRIAP